ncbi:hypothetical protein Rhopal_005605-T1 [Rhodotorula paludigena]|uniref:RING-type domain-containing protein n=1 Tax=Rhodotorula paludigena TaxID=86838 RepID=A0AAV5GRP7_9BASI|nr:hypothetical protein Rhopal_005605-T1 [Rhodotorula paludigena]
MALVRPPALLVAALVLLASIAPVHVGAYIPAVPVNDTSELDGSADTLHLAFYNGVYNTPVSRQLLAQGFDDNGDYTNISAIVPWTKFSKGVLIHFDESLRNQPPAAVPWIAMISCDSNGTSFSEEDDIFTITRDLGAQAALLYSLSSEGCRITEEYITSFEKVLDIYSTTTLQGSRIIESQFLNVKEGAYGYNSSTLNHSATAIQALLDSNALSVIGNVPLNETSSALDESGNPTALSLSQGAVETSPSVFDPDNDDGVATSESASTTPTPTMPSLWGDISSPASLQRRQATGASVEAVPGQTASPTSVASYAAATSTQGITENYLGAVVAAANLTVGGLLATSATPTPSSNSSGGGTMSTSLAMIILYAITGVVTFLFLIVIASGAIRAARHPERYGPRAGGAGGAAGDGTGQTRAGGLTKAILDTFPVVRFGGGGSERRDEEAADEVPSTPGLVAGQKKDAAGDEPIELATLPTLAPAVAASAPPADSRPRAASRASTSAESFHSAESGSLQRRQSTASLGALATIPASPAVATDFTAASPLDAVPPATHADTVDATLASATAAADSDLCPICFCDFEPGDELRVLPCDNRHMFHSACIDPFLLNVSRLCPLCRLDLAVVGGGGAAGEASAEGEGAEGEEGAERREEERVIRHLRALLHRGSHSSGSGVAAGAAAADGDGAAEGRTRRTSEGAEGGARFRSRFAQYVAARRRGGGGAGRVVGAGRRRGSEVPPPAAPPAGGAGAP